MRQPDDQKRKNTDCNVDHNGLTEYLCVGQ